MYNSKIRDDNFSFVPSLQKLKSRLEKFYDLPYAKKAIVILGRAAQAISIIVHATSAKIIKDQLYLLQLYKIQLKDIRRDIVPNFTAKVENNIKTTKTSIIINAFVGIITAAIAFISEAIIRNQYKIRKYDSLFQRLSHRDKDVIIDLKEGKDYAFISNDPNELTTEEKQYLKKKAIQASCAILLSAGIAVAFKIKKVLQDRKFIQRIRDNGLTEADIVHEIAVNLIQKCESKVKTELKRVPHGVYNKNLSNELYKSWDYFKSQLLSAKTFFRLKWLSGKKFKKEIIEIERLYFKALNS